MSPMNILHVEYLKACLEINYKNINKARNIKAITKIIVEYLPLRKDCLLSLKENCIFLTWLTKTILFCKNSQEEMLHIKKDHVFRCLTYNHHQFLSVLLITEHFHSLLLANSWQEEWPTLNRPHRQISRGLQNSRAF